MWLSEDDYGFWPSDIQTFFDNTEGINTLERLNTAARNGRKKTKSHMGRALRLTTRIPLTNPYDSS